LPIQLIDGARKLALNDIAEWEGDLQRLQERLRQNGLTYLDVGAEGNCLFRCIAVYIFNDAERHQQVRRVFSFFVPFSNFQDIVDYIQQNSGKYGEFLTEEIDDYLDRLSRDGTWGDHFAIDAASNVYTAEFIIVESHEAYEVTHVPVRRPRVTIYLAHIAQNHYTLAIPRTLAPADVQRLTRSLQASQQPKGFASTPNARDMNLPFRTVVARRSTSNNDTINYHTLLAEIGVTNIEDKSRHIEDFFTSLRQTRGYFSCLSLLHKVSLTCLIVIKYRPLQALRKFSQT
jgi:hypothetical protein